MATPVKDSKKRTPKRRLVSMNTKEVTLCTAGMNRYHKWVMIKAGDNKDLGNAVPAADASEEDKLKAQGVRSSAYGIEALKKGANLSYVSGDPTTENLYGDPANLLFPLGNHTNAQDVERTKSALVKFKENHGDYNEDSSRARVYERIVRAALSKGIDVSYDPENEIDKLLPADLKTSLQKDPGKSQGSDEGKQSNNKQASSQGANLVDMSWLDGLKQIAAQQAMLKSVKQAVASHSTPIDSTNPTQNKNNEVGNAEGDALKKQVDSLLKREQETATEMKKLKIELAKAKADSSRLSTVLGIPQSRQVEPTKGNVSPQPEGPSDFDDLSPPLPAEGN